MCPVRSVTHVSDRSFEFGHAWPRFCFKRVPPVPSRGASGRCARPHALWQPDENNCALKAGSVKVTGRAQPFWNARIIRKSSSALKRCLDRCSARKKREFENAQQHIGDFIWCRGHRIAAGGDSKPCRSKRWLWRFRRRRIQGRQFCGGPRHGYGWFSRWRDRTPRLGWCRAAGLGRRLARWWLGMGLAGCGWHRRWCRPHGSLGLLRLSVRNRLYLLERLWLGEHLLRRLRIWLVTIKELHYVQEWPVQTVPRSRGAVKGAGLEWTVPVSSLTALFILSVSGHDVQLDRPQTSSVSSKKWLEHRSSHRLKPHVQPASKLF